MRLAFVRDLQGSLFAVAARQKPEAVGIDSVLDQLKPLIVRQELLQIEGLLECL